MANFVEELLHNFFLFDIADFFHDFRCFFNNFFNTLLFHVSRVHDIQNFVFQLIIQIVAFFKVVFCWSRTT